MAIQAFNPVHIRILLDALMRLYQLLLGHKVEEVYHRDGVDPDTDWDEIQHVLQEANDGISSWRRRRIRELGPPELREEDTDPGSDPHDAF